MIKIVAILLPFPTKSLIPSVARKKTEVNGKQKREWDDEIKFLRSY
ncbi:hypothetical protein HMPREF0813_01049 [Streptococcus anginosus F0211]|uniref:Uncharacterized protein n=1 Tax=Streptococcus anginosus F0211 TaxID=706437 RepID=E6J1C3_STRAP|nr:hypothetical protein HMPREF0813_01049 [Streptococcus anginosus F0211]